MDAIVIVILTLLRDGYGFIPPSISIKHQPNAKRDESIIIIRVEDCQHTRHAIHHTRKPTNRRDARTPSRTFGNTQTKKNIAINQSRTSSRASRHVHHTLAVVIHPVARILFFPRCILDVVLGVVGGGVRARTTDVPGTVFVRSHSRSSLRTRTSTNAHRETNRPSGPDGNERNGNVEFRARDPRATSRPRSRRANPVHPPRRPSSPAFGGSSVRFVVNSFVSLRSFHRARTVASASKTAHSCRLGCARRTRNATARAPSLNQSNQSID